MYLHKFLSFHHQIDGNGNTFFFKTERQYSHDLLKPSKYKPEKEVVQTNKLFFGGDPCQKAEKGIM